LLEVSCDPISDLLNQVLIRVSLYLWVRSAGVKTELKPVLMSLHLTFGFEKEVCVALNLRLR